MSRAHPTATFVLLLSAWMAASARAAPAPDAVFPPGSGPSAPTLEDRITEQVADLASLRAEVAALREQEGPSAVAVPPRRTRPPGRGDAPPLLHGTPVGGVRWGGYLTAEYVAPSERNSFFDLDRVVLKVDGEATSRIAVEGEVEFENGGATDELEGEVALEYFQVLFGISDAFTPKVGALLIPFGRYNLHHDDPQNDFTFRPFTAQFLVPTGFGQPGIGVEGTIPVGRCGATLSYDVALTNGYRDDFTAAEGVRDARQHWFEDENEGKQVWGRVAFAAARGFLDTFEVGLSGTWSRFDAANRNDLLGFAVDGVIRKGPFEAKGEYIAYRYDRNADDPPDSIEGQSGLWLEGAWHFLPPCLRCRRGCLATDTSHFTLCARWQWADLDDHVRGATFEDDNRAWSVGLNYRVTERTVFRVDWTRYDAVNEPDRHAFTASFSTYF